VERSLATSSERESNSSGRGPADSAAGSWNERYGRLYDELWRPARAMVKRAFGSAFGEDAIEDLYGNAWLGTLRALERRQTELSDAELRKYLLTAVANQASKELRRRGRRPTTPLEMAKGVPDGRELPDERAAGNEESRIARDVLGTLPARRRAVLMLRYGWGLEPREVCGLIEGLSPRAYRKEITRGVNEVSSKLRLVEQGRWCGNREPVLKAYVAGVADDEQRRQAEHHLAHCRHCTDYVAKLNGHLHEIGSAVAWPGAADVLGGDRISIADRVGEIVDRTRESALGVFNRSGSESADTAAQAAAAGGTRGAGVGAAGGLAKLAAIGSVPKLVAACVGTGAAATACVAAGVTPVHLPDTSDRPDSGRPVAERPNAHDDPPVAPPSLPTQVGHEAPPPEPPSSEGPTAGGAGGPPAPAPEPAPAPAPPPAPPVDQEFGLEPAAPTDPSYSSSSGGSSGASGLPAAGGSTAVTNEFGP
jgi:RNA polymerase sigma factor (sigma-70 family)